MLDVQGLLVDLLDAFAYATTTALAVIGLCVIAVIAYRWASR